MADALTIQCLLIRKGGTIVELQGGDYHFAPNEAGDHVCDVADEDDIATLLGIKESYRLYRPKKADASAKPPAEPEKPQTEPAAAKGKAPAKGKAAKPPAEPEKPVALGLPGAVKNEDLAGLDRDAVVAIFTAEIGRAPSEHAEIDVMIAQIINKREEGAD